MAFGSTFLTGNEVDVAKLKSDIENLAIIKSADYFDTGLRTSNSTTFSDLLTLTIPVEADEIITIDTIINFSMSSTTYYGQFRTLINGSPYGPVPAMYDNKTSVLGFTSQVNLSAYVFPGAGSVVIKTQMRVENVAATLYCSYGLMAVTQEKYR